MKYSIVLVPFPFDDLSRTKIRPAICLTDPISIYEHVVIAFITSQVGKADESSDLVIMKGEVGFARSGLKVSSAIRLHRLVTIPKRLIHRKLGELPSQHHPSLKEHLLQLFDLK
ncbi:MAG: type II toxin-antitoxin system PemK/MazF family toxin [Bacteroidota bacterium]